jgi:uncharacterized protein DUF2806
MQMADNEELPTIGEAISQWLGVRLPTIPLPQTRKNIDKALGKLVLAVGENLEARIRGSTNKTKAKDKIDVAGMFRTEEERRKLENRAAAVQEALEDLHANPGSADAQAEIEDDWLNLFARLAEDKSSDDLRRLFGKILAGEIKKPGSFSLRTIQLLSTVSKDELTQVSDFLSYAIGTWTMVPFELSFMDEDESESRPAHTLRLLMEELGIAGHPSRIGGPALTVTLEAGKTYLGLASHRGIMVKNQAANSVKFTVLGQILTASSQELLPIANSPVTDTEFLKGVASQIYSSLRETHAADVDGGLVSVHVVTAARVDEERVQYEIIFTVPKP